MASCYRIKNWKGCFEVAQNAACKTWSWIAVPIKHDGKSYRRLMALPNGPAIYGAWILIAAVAAKCEPRGTLLDDGEPLTAEDLFFKTGAPQALFEEALEVLATSRIGWVEKFDTQASLEHTQASLERAAPTLELPDITEPDITTGSEAESGLSAKEDSGEKKPSSFGKLLEEHLDDDRIMASWHDFACSRDGPLFPKSDVSLLRVLGAALHASNWKGARNRVAVFSAIVKKGDAKGGWRVITTAEEDEARRRLKNLNGKVNH